MSRGVETAPRSLAGLQESGIRGQPNTGQREQFQGREVKEIEN